MFRRLSALGGAILATVLLAQCGLAGTPDTARHDLLQASVGRAQRIGLVTDQGRINDGIFAQFAYEGMQQAASDLGLKTGYIETQAQSDYETNIQTFVDEHYNVIITVGFMIGDATYAAAIANPTIRFIGVDQGYVGKPIPQNLVGIQFREDQAGFLVGALAGLLTRSGTVAVVAGVDIPPVKRYVNGYQRGVKYVNPGARVLTIYVPTFTDPSLGASAATQLLGEGADIVFGAGGPTGAGAITAAAAAGALVIGVDQDEYITTFGKGTVPHADRLLTSAIKRIDIGVAAMVRAAVLGGFPGGGLYTLTVTNGGIGFADYHQARAAVPAAVRQRMLAILGQLHDGSLSTGVDAISGDLEQAPAPAPTVP